CLGCAGRLKATDDQRRARQRQGWPSRLPFLNAAEIHELGSESKMTTEIHDHHRHGRLSQQSTLALKEMVSGAVSGVLAAIVTAPLDLAKTRMQVQQHFKPTTNPGSGIDLRYTSLSGTLARTLREEGARGLFKGLGSTIFGLVPNWAIYFSTYGRL
ncbi:hypothetical protein BVRB_037250, partial [Beta vulgaris subsp. vulgaris]